MNYETANPMDLEDQPTQAIDESSEQTVELFGTNLAKGRSADLLMKIADQCYKGFQTDLDSRSDWEDDLDDWIRLANQVREAKTFPWPKASNVKYPLLSTAAMQFAARAYPSLVPANGQVVTAKPVGMDQTGEKLDKATRVSKFMSYQVMHDISGWEEDMDRMLMMLPVTGTMFKKTWFDKTEDKIKSQLILPKNIVVNYWTRSLADCERISEVIEISRRKMKEKQLAGVYLNVDLGDPVMDGDSNGYTADDETVPYTIVEQHTFWDMDDDGYSEPYIITFELESKKILRIQARFTPEGLHLDEKGKVMRIDPLQMYTKFGFVPNPDGSFYDIGFGILLGPLNESVNTLINQLVDSGTVNNLQSGFIGKSLRIKMGEAGFTPGEWKPVNATGDDLRKQIVPLPAKEPSNVLFQLMGTLITSGKELASVAEIFVGKMPGQNTPATTTMASIEQGMKVFTAVYKRLYRSLAEEFMKIFYLNKLYIDPNHVVKVLDIQVGPDDFDPDTCDVTPGADPTAMSQTEKLMKAQGLMELLQMAGPILDPIKVISRVLEAQEQPNWQELFSQEVQQTGQVPPAPPDPKLMAIQAKMEADQRKNALDIQSKQMQMELDGRDKQMQMAMKAQEHAQKMQMDRESAMQKSASEIQMANIFAAAERTKAVTQVANQQDKHEQTMQQAKEKASLSKSQGSSSKSGKTTQSRKPSEKR